MARTLKTYVTSVGFFELAVAAPSMKAALEAWGAERNLFQHGYARETRDPQIIVATMAKPGVVLKRAIGSGDPFSENAALPKSFPAEPPKEKRAKDKPEIDKSGAKVVSLADERAARIAAAAFEKEQARRAREREREEAARERERARREEAIGKAEAALELARERHDKTVKALEAERESLDHRAQAEDARWEKESERLEAALRNARN